MEIIPAINCEEVACVASRLAEAKGFLPKEGWVHIDVADARFTFNKLWNNPKELPKLLKTVPGLSVEVHLMVEHPEEVVSAWLKGGAQRVIVHHEALYHSAVRKSKNISELADAVRKQCKEAGAEFALAINPETPAEKLFLYRDYTNHFLFLAVHPGLSGQHFYLAVLPKIKLLRQQLPDAIIEVDGGVNEEIAKLLKDVGTNMVAAASFIFASEDPAGALKALQRV